MNSSHRLALPLALLLLSPFAQAADFLVESPDIHEADSISGQHVYNGMGCKGDNISPALIWRNAPAGTRGFAITVHDLDAPDGGGWHWVVVNLPAKTSEIERGAAKLPAGSVQTRNDFGGNGYGGPCPPPGKPHRYEFSVWALKSDTLKIDANAPAALASVMIRQNALGQAKITASYGR